jgi:hypothetical protein
MKLGIEIFIAVVLCIVAFVVGGIGAAIGMAGTALIFMWLGHKDRTELSDKEKNRIEYEESNWGL